MGTNAAHSPWENALLNAQKYLTICFDQLDSNLALDPMIPPHNVSVVTTYATNITFDTFCSITHHPTRQYITSGHQKKLRIFGTPYTGQQASPNIPTYETTVSILSPAAIELEDIFDPDKIRHYHVNKFAWRDEFHQKCYLKTIMGANVCGYTNIIRRDVNNNPIQEGQKNNDSLVNVNIG